VSFSFWNCRPVPPDPVTPDLACLCQGQVCSHVLACAHSRRTSLQYRYEDGPRRVLDVVVGARRWICCRLFPTQNPARPECLVMVYCMGIKKIKRGRRKKKRMMRVKMGRKIQVTYKKKKLSRTRIYIRKDGAKKPRKGGKRKGWFVLEKFEHFEWFE
jgi:hypothetical protein